MLASETVRSATEAADLVNSLPARGGRRGNIDAHVLEELIKKYKMRYYAAVTEEDCRQIEQLREILEDIFTCGDRDIGAAHVNRLLSMARFCPWLADHDGLDWHVHYFRPDALLAERIAADLGMAFAIILVSQEWERLKVCGKPSCNHVFLDTTKNKSKIYCDDGTCASTDYAQRYRTQRRLNGQ